MRISPEAKQIVELNNIGTRIKWVRKQLKLTQMKVVKDTGFCYKRYTLRESGVRTAIVEEYLALVDYFNSKWNTPANYKGVEISEITLEFILFGTHNDQSRINQIILKKPL